MTILMSVSFSSCGNDSDDIDPDSSNTIVGTTWVWNSNDSNKYKRSILFLSKTKALVTETWQEKGKNMKQEQERTYKFDEKSMSGHYINSYYPDENNPFEIEVEFEITGTKMIVNDIVGIYSNGKEVTKVDHEKRTYYKQ